MKSNDLSFDQYQSRIQASVSPENLQRSLESISFGHKFEWINGAWQPIAYPGFAVLSMVRDHALNELLEKQLVDIQRKVVEEADLDRVVFRLQPESFHQTIANTLSTDRFQRHLVDHGLVGEYPPMVQQAFDHITLPANTEPIQMRLIGLSAFRSAWGIMGLFDDVYAYQRIIRFRDQFYGQPNLNEVDVKWTRPFIGHLTLGYFGREMSSPQRQLFGRQLTEVNQSLAREPLTFYISQTSLRRYDHLAVFSHSPAYPTFSFVS